MKKVFLTAAIAAVVCMGSVAQAAIQFSQSDLLSMTIYNPLTYGFTATANTGTGLTSDPNYNYGSPVRTMTGLAGAVGNLAPQPSPPLPAAIAAQGWSATAFYTLGAAQLTALNAAVAGGESLINAVGWNDNDDTWVVGIWATDSTWPFGNPSGGTDGLVLAAGTGGALSLDLSTFLSLGETIANAGVFVALQAGSANDTYHASWGVPEPTSILVWSALAMVSIAAGRRNRS